MSNCCNTRIIQVTGAGGGGGPYVTTADTPNPGDLTVLDTASGNDFVVPAPVLARALEDVDADTAVRLIENGGAAGGDRIDFEIDGVVVGSGEILAGGIIKWTFGGIMDPVVYRPTPITTADRDTIYTPIAVDGDLIYNSDDEQYQVYDSTIPGWKPFGEVDEEVWQFTPGGGATTTVDNGERWIVGVGDTVAMPTPVTGGESMSFAPGNGDWDTLGATFITTDTSSFMAGQSNIITGGDVLTVVYNVATDNWVGFIGTEAPAGVSNDENQGLVLGTDLLAYGELIPSYTGSNIDLGGFTTVGGLVTEGVLQAAYDAAVLPGQAPDTIPPSVLTAAVGQGAFQLYLGHNRWYSNSNNGNANSWVLVVQGGDNKASFTIDVDKAWTYDGTQNMSTRFLGEQNLNGNVTIDADGNLQATGGADEVILGGGAPAGTEPEDLFLSTAFGGVWHNNGGTWEINTPLRSETTGSNSYAPDIIGQQIHYTGTGGDTLTVNAELNLTSSGSAHKWVFNDGTGDLTIAASGTLTGGISGYTTVTPGTGALLTWSIGGLSVISYQVIGGSSSGSNHVFLDATSVAASDVNNPSEAEILAALGGATSVVAYYTATDLASQEPLRIYDVDAAGALQTIEHKSISAANPGGQVVLEVFDTLNETNGFTGTQSSTHHQVLAITQTGQITAATFQIRTTGANSNVRFRIFAGIGAGGTPLVDVNQNITNSAFADITFNIPALAVTPGNYTFALVTQSGSNSQWQGTGDVLAAPMTSSFSPPNDYKIRVEVLDPVNTPNVVKGNGDEIELDTSGFTGNLNSTTETVQDLADVVDGLSGGGIMTTDSVQTGPRVQDGGRQTITFNELGDWNQNYRDSSNNDLEGTETHTATNHLFSIEDISTNIRGEVSISGTNIFMRGSNGTPAETVEISIQEGGGNHQLEIITPEVSAGNAAAGRPLTLVDAGTGEVEYAVVGTDIDSVTGSNNIAIGTLVHYVTSAVATTQTLPAANAVPASYKVHVKRQGTGNITVVRGPGDTIDSAAANYDYDNNNILESGSVTFVSDGVSNWIVV